MKNKIIILTGEKQSGKTTLLQQFCQQHNNVAGILTPVVDDQRVFYDIAANQYFLMEAARDEASITVGKYLFSAAAFVQANTILMDVSARNNYQYVIIDEIGPLEIKQHQGLYQSLVKILGSPFNFSLIIVIRPALLDEAITTFSLADAQVFTTASMKALF